MHICEHTRAPTRGGRGRGRSVRAHTHAHVWTGACGVNGDSNNLLLKQPHPPTLNLAHIQTNTHSQTQLKKTHPQILTQTQTQTQRDRETDRQTDRQTHHPIHTLSWPPYFVPKPKASHTQLTVIEYTHTHTQIYIFIYIQYSLSLSLTLSQSSSQTTQTSKEVTHAFNFHTHSLYIKYCAHNTLYVTCVWQKAGSRVLCGHIYASIR